MTRVVKLGSGTFKVPDRAELVTCPACGEVTGYKIGTAKLELTKEQHECKPKAPVVEAALPKEGA